MSESAELERALLQGVTAAVSVAAGLAGWGMQRLAQKAREADALAEEEQRAFAARAAAERETAAVLWHRVDAKGAPQWMRERPEQVAQAWASARAWERLDPRAAEAAAKLDFLMTQLYKQENPLVRLASDSEDFDALAELLRRAVEITPEHAQETQVWKWEEVPEAEREQWLQRVVYGPDSSPEDRVAASEKLEDLQRGLPVAVLREMDPKNQRAWMAWQGLSVAERAEWQRSWLLGKAWGPGSSDEQRAWAVEQLRNFAPGSVVLGAEEWQAWLKEHHDRTAAAAADEPGVRQGSTREGSSPAAEAHQQPSTRSVTYQESEDELLARLRAVVWQEWPSEVARAVTDDPAFGAFAHRVDQLRQRGWREVDVLGMVNPSGLIGMDRYGQPIKSAAAFGEWHLKQLVRSLPDRGIDAAPGVANVEAYLQNAEATLTGPAHQGTGQVPASAYEGRGHEPTMPIPAVTANADAKWGESPTLDLRVGAIQGGGDPGARTLPIPVQLAKVSYPDAWRPGGGHDGARPVTAGAAHLRVATHQR